MSKVWILIALVIIVGAGAYFMMANQTPAPVETTRPPAQLQTKTPATATEYTVKLDVQNESSESGTAVLSEMDGKVMVTLNMTGAPADVPQPAHIHIGSCPNVGAVSYPLTNVVNGKSVTTLDVTLAQLAAKQPLGINVHKSVPETKVYVSCGNLALPPAASSTTTVPAPAPPSNTGY